MRERTANDRRHVGAERRGPVSVEVGIVGEDPPIVTRAPAIEHDHGARMRLRLASASRESPEGIEVPVLDWRCTCMINSRSRGCGHRNQAQRYEAMVPDHVESDHFSGAGPRNGSWSSPRSRTSRAPSVPGVKVWGGRHRSVDRSFSALQWSQSAWSVGKVSSPARQRSGNVEGSGWHGRMYNLHGTTGFPRTRRVEARRATERLVLIFYP
jgi:hypothetical protein